MICIRLRSRWVDQNVVDDTSVCANAIRHYVNGKVCHRPKRMAEERRAHKLHGAEDEWCPFNEAANTSSGCSLKQTDKKLASTRTSAWSSLRQTLACLGLCCAWIQTIRRASATDSFATASERMKGSRVFSIPFWRKQLRRARFLADAPPTNVQRVFMFGNSAGDLSGGRRQKRPRQGNAPMTHELQILQEHPRKTAIIRTTIQQ